MRAPALRTIGLAGALALAAAVATVAACSSSETSPPPDDTSADGVELPDGRVFTRAALLEDVALCIGAQTTDLAGATATLRAAVRAAEADPSRRSEAQAAWIAAMDVLQRLEVAQVGPAAIKTQLGGQALRDQIYAWPLTSACQVAENLVSRGWESGDFDEALINVRGLATLEQLLFQPVAENGCPEGHAMNTDGSWAGLGDDELAARRAAYAVAVADDIHLRAEELRTAWDPGGGDFTGELAGAGSGSRTFARESLALNAISDALFYLEYATKDLKVARPAGLTGCDAATCPDLVESPWGARSKEHVRANLIGFRRLFDGCSEGDLGFDEYLIAAGAPDLGASILQAVDGALAAIDAIEEADLPEALVSDPVSVVALHASLKQITDLLRTQFLSVLDLEIPRRVEGDND